MSGEILPSVKGKIIEVKIPREFFISPFREEFERRGQADRRWEDV
jgi:hypothetical protein